MPHLIADPVVRERLRLEARRIAQESWDETQDFCARIDAYRRSVETRRILQEASEDSYATIARLAAAKLRRGP
jgi:hypothetical protein